MKVASVILSIVSVLLLALIASFFIGGTLGAEVSVQAVNAAEVPEVFEAVRSVMNGGLAVQEFRETNLGEAFDYVLIDLQFTFKNKGLFNAEWLYGTIEPGAGDIAVYSRSAEKLDVSARASGEFNLKVIAHADTYMAGERELVVEYYVLGMKRTARIACSG